ncbi:MAG: Gldg family protein [Planctomycetota bacterium]
MRAVPLALLIALGVGSVVLATRVLDRYETGGWGRLEVGRERVSSVTPRLRDRLERLDENLALTYFVTPAADMPSAMRDIETDVTDLLQALRAVAPERIDFQIVDPAAREELGAFTSKRRVAPFRVRTVERDAYSETSVYSTLAISYGARPEVAIDGIGPAHLSRLQSLLVAHLDELEHPTAPRFGLSAPPGFEEFADHLAERGAVTRLDLDLGDPVPEDVDLLFWLRPETVFPETLAELDRFLARGKSLVVAGSLAEPGPLGLRDTGDGPVVQFERRSSQWPQLLTHLGLSVAEGLVIDERAEPIVVAGEEHVAPFLVRCIAPNQDFQRWREQPNGTLLFFAPSPLGANPTELAQRRVDAHVLATTSDRTRLGPLPVDAPLEFSRLDAHGDATPKLPLIVGLEPHDPWAGHVVALAASTPFENGALRRAGTAHVRLVETLVRQLASSERLVASQADLARADPLPPLSRRERVWWRAATVFLVPVLLGLAALATLGRGGGFVLGRRTTRSVAQLSLALTGLALVLWAVAAVRHADVTFDATQDSIYELPSPVVSSLASDLGGRLVRAMWHVSSPSTLPPAWRPAVRRFEERLERFRAAGLIAELEVRHPDESDALERATLAETNVEPFEITTESEDRTTVRSLFATLVLESEGERHVLPFRRLRGFDEPDFAIALGLRTLALGRAPRIAFASDVPRLSAAEAYEGFQQQGLFAPQGADVYSLARETLDELGFDVVHINPRRPELPSDIDVLVWMQPRRSIEPMLHELVRHLVGGGPALLAAQHFVVQARQFRGSGFEHVYWPQPQSNDLEHLYLPECGIFLEREVLFDARSTRIQDDTRVAGRSEGRDVEVQESALPFLVRTASANSSPDSPITRRLGDQAFLWPDSIRWDEARLDALGLEATPLITTTERTWSFAWKGGYLPPEVLLGPDGDFAGRRTLAARFDGTFPAPDRALSLDRSEDAFEVPDDWPAPEPSSLVVIGNSRLFRNERLFDEEFRARDLLVNAVAALAFDDALAELAGRRPVPRGFDYVPPEERLRWRAIVLAVPPLVLLVLGTCLTLLRRRPLARTRA